MRHLASLSSEPGRNRREYLDASALAQQALKSALAFDPPACEAWLAARPPPTALYAKIALTSLRNVIENKKTHIALEQERAAKIGDLLREISAELPRLETVERTLNLLGELLWTAELEDEPKVREPAHALLSHAVTLDVDATNAWLALGENPARWSEVLLSKEVVNRLIPLAEPLHLERLSDENLRRLTARLLELGRTNPQRHHIAPPARAMHIKRAHERTS